ncbi:hypothetical protein F2Q69_00013630 [Brassica cretica]|uniref:Uncharacterized protein n=1 Tax=Brassica cretica TaxID=69181 RepID=A0A8S9QR50_BRACR|nr:hypothetical protein F2Q69_00013630 [Brassica cretica]
MLTPLVDERCISKSLLSPYVLLLSEKSKNSLQDPLGNRCHHLSYQVSLLLILGFSRSLIPTDQSLLWCKNLVETLLDLSVVGRRRSMLSGVCRSMLWVVDTIKLHLEVTFILFLGSTDSIKHLIDLILGVDLWF